MEHKAVLIRAISQPLQTMGSFHLFSGAKEVYEACVLELPDLGNQKFISRIPAGTYEVIKSNSPRYGLSFHIKAVFGRTHILIHAGNYKKDTKGCILLGATFKDIDRDGLADVTSSRKMIKELKKITDGFR